MKKHKIFRIFAIVAVLLTAVFVLAACSTQINVPGSLTRQWDKTEQVLSYVIFGVKDGARDAEIGTMEMTVKKFEGETAAVGKKRLDNFTGHRASYQINMRKDGVDVEIKSEVAFTSDGEFSPLYSYKSISDGEKAYTLTTEYIKKRSSTDCQWSYVKDGETTSGAMTLKGVFYDNEMIFALARSCPLDQIGETMNFAFTVASPLDDPSSPTQMRLQATGKKEITYLADGQPEAEVSAYGLSYVSANGGSNALEIYCVKTSDFKVDAKETYIPAVIRQNGIEYVFNSKA
ncbi:MAG: hypothetical protein LBQ40_00755 [Clostridiales bacterium]|jgi:hypothetical protein|nr:hypothetical protein [Clostridiales bacterium]